jgi:membrane protein required for colicin V production
MPTLTGWDWFVLVTAVLSVFSGALSGLSRTLGGLAGWVLAVVGTPLAAPALVRAGELHAFEVLVWLGLFIVLLLIGRVGVLLIVRTPGARGPTGADRLAGATWGLARALVLVVAAVAVAGVLGMSSQPSWRHALSRPLLDVLLQSVEPHLPLARIGQPRN